LIASRSEPLRGTITVPGDKSISHRALMLSGVAVGESTITGLLESEDVINTYKAMAALGVDISRTPDGTWHVHGVGIAGLQQSDGEIDFGNSGTGVRLAAGLMATTPLTARLTGDASLCKRPMKRIIAPLQRMGARFAPDGAEHLPLTLHGAAHPVPITYELPVPSAQVKSAVLLAALNTPGTTTVIEREPTRDHSERMLKSFGARIETETHDGATHIHLSGRHELKAQAIAVPGDPSSAAFAIVAALITQGSDVTIENVLLNPTRIGLVETLLEMGADIAITERRESGGEEIGTIRARSSSLRGVRVPPQRAPSMIDEYPILAVAAACAEGTTHMAGLAELRVKESDRLSAVLAGLEANGVAATAGEDWLEVTGGPVPGGGLVHTHLDHRIAMAFCILGLVADTAVTIDDADVVATSFPEFTGLMQSLGANVTLKRGRP
jgi:3-phosphoshikimate 1-carboxyvinyltransferase